MAPSSPHPYESFEKFEITNLGENNPFLLARKTIFTPRDKFFKYRLLQGDIFCNKRLHRFKMSPTPYCNYCLVQEESIKHLIWDCPRSSEAWSIFNSITRQCYNMNYATYDSVILGHPDPVSVLESLVVEVLKIIMKQNREDQINVELIKNQFRLYYRLEKMALKGKELKNFRRWQKLEQAINL
jgi:hypothetical protein